MVTDCELLNTCPYYNGVVEMPESVKGEYCKGNHRWCGRYMIYRDLERERRSRFNLKSAQEAKDG